MTPREFYGRLDAWQKNESAKRNDLAVRIALWMNGKNPNDYTAKKIEKPKTAKAVLEML